MIVRLTAIALLCLFAAACAARPSSSSSPATSPEDLMRQACSDATSVQYAVEASNIALAPAITPASDGGFELAGSVDKGAEGIKQLKCRFDSSRKLYDVMAMTPDGE